MKREEAEEAAAIPHSREGLEVILIDPMKVAKLFACIRSDAFSGFLLHHDSEGAGSRAPTQETLHPCPTTREGVRAREVEM
jgi:hypothetical protein